MKASAFAEDTGTKIAQIQRLAREIKFKVEFKLLKIKKGILGCFSVNPCNYLLKICNRKVLEIRETCSKKEAETN